MTKECWRCKEKKPDKEFHLLGVQEWCNACIKEQYGKNKTAKKIEADEKAIKEKTLKLQQEAIKAIEKDEIKKTNFGLNSNKTRDGRIRPSSAPVVQTQIDATRIHVCNTPKKMLEFSKQTKAEIKEAEKALKISKSANDKAKQLTRIRHLKMDLRFEIALASPTLKDKKVQWVGLLNNQQIVFEISGRWFKTNTEYLKASGKDKKKIPSLLEIEHVGEIPVTELHAYPNWK